MSSSSSSGSGSGALAAAAGAAPPAAATAAADLGGADAGRPERSLFRHLAVAVVELGDAAGLLALGNESLLQLVHAVGGGLRQELRLVAVRRGLEGLGVDLEVVHTLAAGLRADVGTVEREWWLPGKETDARKKIRFCARGAMRRVQEGQWRERRVPSAAGGAPASGACAMPPERGKRAA